MRPLLIAVGRAAWREARTLNSIQGNNFFYFALLLSLQPEAMGFVWLLVGLLLMFPALLAPLAKIPALRLQLWPLEKRATRFLQIFARPDLPHTPWLWRVLPALELRQYCRSLDFALACVFAVMASLLRFFTPQLDPEALPILSLLVVLMLSTLAQNLFALDGRAGRLRWRLSPAPGWRILARKGLPLVLLTGLLTLPLSPLPAVTGMLAALAIGHHFSVQTPLDAAPWRFTAGQFFPYGLLQVFALFSSGIAVARGEIIYFPLAFLAWVGSLLVYGRVLESASLEKL